jgi:uncharacterized membrane protein YgcG
MSSGHRHHFSGCTCHRFSHTVVKLLLALALLGLIIPLAAHGQFAAQSNPPSRPEGRVLRLSDVEGQVSLLQGNETQFDQAVANMPLFENTLVQTGDNGRAEIQIEDGSIIRLVPGSQFRVGPLGGSTQGALQTNVELLAGEAYFELRPATGDTFTVTASGVQIVPVPSGSFRIDLGVQPQQIAVSDGSTHVTHGTDYNTQVNADQTLNLNDQDPGKYQIAQGTSSSPDDQWNEDRDQLIYKEQASASGAQSGGDSAGWDDLDYNGQFYDVPGAGSIWQPYGVDANWDPYDAGYWAYYPWGYSWISAYPWGWSPYHCGYWNYYDGFGWGWAGGGCGIGTWYPVSPWYHRPHWWHPPIIPPPHPIGFHPPPHGRLTPVGIVVQHPFKPMPAQPVPPEARNRPVTIGGHVVSPRPPAPRVSPTERGGSAIQAVPERAGESNSRSGTQPAPKVWHGGNGYSRPTPAPAPHSSSPPSHSGGGGGGGGGGSHGGGGSSGGGGGHK